MISNTAKVALAAARSAIGDGRDVGANTAAVIVAELERITEGVNELGDFDRDKYRDRMLANLDAMTSPDEAIETLLNWLTAEATLRAAFGMQGLELRSRIDALERERQEGRAGIELVEDERDSNVAHAGAGEFVTDELRAVAERAFRREWRARNTKLVEGGMYVAVEFYPAGDSNELANVLANKGYLYALNTAVLHPVGLALGVDRKVATSECTALFVAGTDDVEGITFDELAHNESIAKLDEPSLKLLVESLIVTHGRFAEELRRRKLKRDAETAGDA